MYDVPSILFLRFPPRFAYPYVSVSIADSFTAKPLLKTLMMTDTVNVKDGGVI